MRCLGIDSSLIATGYCLYDDNQLHHYGTWRSPKSTQFERMLYQSESLRGFIAGATPTYLAIEKPYVLPMKARGRGGEQSSNLFALYSLILWVAREFQLPIAMFHISQLRSLIHGRAGTDKIDTITLAQSEVGKSLDEHQADAYFVAKYGLRFWKTFDKVTDKDSLTPKEERIYSSQEMASKHPVGMIYRPGDAWYDFRVSRPAEIPLAWQNPFPPQLLTSKNK